MRVSTSWAWSRVTFMNCKQIKRHACAGEVARRARLYLVKAEDNALKPHLRDKGGEGAASSRGSGMAE